MFDSATLTKEKNGTYKNDEYQSYYNELYLKIQGIKIFCMIMQNKKRYQDYKFNKRECTDFWSRFHLLCYCINKDITTFNNKLLATKKNTKKHNNLYCLNDLSYEINVCTSALKKFKKFEISRTLDMHLKRKVYFKWVFNDYLAGGDIQLINPLTTERCEVSCHNGHHHVFIFEGKNVVESQITLDDEFQHTISYDEAYNEIHYFQLSVNYIYKYLNKGYIPTVIRDERLMGYDHFCSHIPLQDVLMGIEIGVFDFRF
jgi:hypothetical protein